MDNFFPIGPPDTKSSAMPIFCPECGSRKVQFLAFAVSLAARDVILRLDCDQQHSFEFHLVGDTKGGMALLPFPERRKHE